MALKELNEIYKLIENLKFHGEYDRRGVFECTSYWSENFGDRDQYSGEVYCADNLEIMRSLATSDFKGKFQMIYMDPPFYSGAKYFSRRSDGSKKLAYSDVWGAGLLEYLEMIAKRILIARGLLSDDGLIWIHLDYRAVHYVKIIMDEIFGMENMVNEIVWGYRSGGASGKRFARKHDTILLYSKTSKLFACIK